MRNHAYKNITEFHDTILHYKHRAKQLRKWNHELKSENIITGKHSSTPEYDFIIHSKLQLKQIKHWNRMVNNKIIRCILQHLSKIHLMHLRLTQAPFHTPIHQSNHHTKNRMPRINAPMRAQHTQRRHSNHKSKTAWIIPLDRKCNLKGEARPGERIQTPPFQPSSEFHSAKP